MDIENKDVSEKDIQEIEDMLKTNIEIDNKHVGSDEYKLLFTRAQNLYPDMPPFLIQMALLSYLEEQNI